MTFSIQWLYANDLIGSLMIVGVGVISAIIIDIILKLLDGATKFTKTNLDDYIIKALRRPIFLGVTFGAIFIAALKTDVLINYHTGIAKSGTIFAILMITYGLTRLIKTAFQWYGKSGEKSFIVPIDDRYLRVFRKGINILVYAIGIMIVLKKLNIEITPLITSLGIGGLVIALALQETLSNFFAGFTIITENSIKIGDFIELDNGVKGFVDDMSWRVTKIRTLPNNIVLVPNSKLAQVIITDYDSYQKEMSVLVEVGVAYESDLEKVEKITIDVAKKIQKTVNGAVKKHEPFIRYHTFADSNINFSVILRGETFVDQYLLKHEFIKALNKAYRKNKITINYPVRVMKK